jgi:hypothetical protein
MHKLIQIRNALLKNQHPVEAAMSGRTRKHLNGSALSTKSAGGTLPSIPEPVDLWATLLP